MNDEQLIAELVRTHRPVPKAALEKRLWGYTAVGFIVAAALVIHFTGLRPDLGPALSTFPFWMKWVYVAALALGALLGIQTVARPDAGAPTRLWLLLLPMAVMGVLAAWQALSAPAGSWTRQWMGISWDSCPTTIALFSIPVFAALIMAFRTFAPTNLRLAGFLAGLASGSLSAFAYALHCPETSAVFVVIWYSAGIFIPAGVGALLGPRLLRW